MIRFACRQCGQRYERPDGAAGMLVFCACGTSNQVPWSSTWEEPAAPLAIPVEVPATVPWGTPVPARPWTPSESPRPVLRRRDPAFCFNHQAVPCTEVCCRCGEKFCTECVARFQEQTWCGPCKNFHVRSLQRPPHVAVMAIFAPLVALLTAPVAVFLLLMIAGLSAAPGFSSRNAQGAMILAFCALLGLLCQLLAFGLGAFSLRRVESDPQLSGRALAMTGMVASVTCAILIGVFAILALRLVN